MTARDTLPADPELLAARPPNPAATAQPGWRGTDRKGGTWVRLDREDLWFEILAAGRGSYRSQEEAEAAGLVQLAPAWSEALRSRFSARPHLTITDLKFEPAAPAPLDPGNPEHPEIVTAGDLRWFAGVLHSRAGNWGCLDASHPVVAAIRAYADRLDRERAEAERLTTEATKLAAVLADFAIYDTDGSRDDAILAGHLVRRGVRVIEQVSE